MDFRFRKDDSKSLVPQSLSCRLQTPVGYKALLSRLPTPMAVQFSPVEKVIQFFHDISREFFKLFALISSPAQDYRHMK